MIDPDKREQDRVALQVSLDRQRLSNVRNSFGQFSTPTALAMDIVSLTLSNCDAKDGMTFIEPGLGTGAFTSALLHSGMGSGIRKIIGYELDKAYCAAAKKFWSAKAEIDIRNADFTRAAPSHDDLADMIISGIWLSGLSGLYCYFIALCHQWLKPGGIACWLIPSEFMDVNYGQMLKEYLLKKVTLLRVHRFNPEEVQFGDALVRSPVRESRPEIRLRRAVHLWWDAAQTLAYLAH